MPSIADTIAFVVSPRIEKSQGQTDSERYLGRMCERSFLDLWTYPNPFKDDHHELCDVLAVFEDQVFVFFDREKQLIADEDSDLPLKWNRWKRSVVDRQIKTALGAERYIRSGRQVFLDAKCGVPLPIPIDLPSVTVHKIIVAHGAKQACLDSSSSNVSGSLAIAYGRSDHSPDFPFLIGLSRVNPVHVFDSESLPIILDELDTVFDFAAFLNAKYAALSRYKSLCYCAEEDLLAHYYSNYDAERQRHFIGSEETGFDFVFIGEGEWEGWKRSDTYEATKKANRDSYLWDQIIRKTTRNALDGTLLGDSDIFGGKSAVHEMAKEPRFIRRELARAIRSATNRFPDGDLPGVTRNLTFMPSWFRDKAYVFLQLWAEAKIRQDADYRPFRQRLLEVACGAAKNKYPHLRTIVGIAVDAPKHADEVAEDFVLLDCEQWTDDVEAYYREINSQIGFFASSMRAETRTEVTEFVSDEDE